MSRKTRKKVFFVGVNDRLRISGGGPDRPVLGIRDILVRIGMRTLESVPLTNVSGCGSERPKNIQIRIRMRIRNYGTFTSFFKDKK
jgi:hypothetical protein